MTDTIQPDTRPIPPLPGGGSWRFDEQAWEWVSNDPAPVEASPETPSADQE